MSATGAIIQTKKFLRNSFKNLGILGHFLIIFNPYFFSTIRTINPFFS